MTVAIATSNNRSERLRALSAKHPYMTTLDIAKLTGESHRLVKLALGRGFEPKRRIEARGPLTAAQIAENTGMPLASAKLMVR